VEPAPELVDESPLGRVSRATAGGAVAVFGALGVIAFIDEDLGALRPIALAVGGAAALAAAAMEWRARRSADAGASKGSSSAEPG